MCIFKCVYQCPCPTGRVFQCRVGSGRVLEKIPGSGSGSGRVGVLKYTIGYFRVSVSLSGISGYSWVFSGISRYFPIFLGMLDLDIISVFGGGEANIKAFSNNY